MDGLAAFTIFLIFFIIIWFLAMNGCVRERHNRKIIVAKIQPADYSMNVGGYATM